MVVHFPEYTGVPLLDGLPRTWLPVPCVEVQNKQTLRYVRVGLPLRLAYALTIHKAQGLSLFEGAVVDLQVSNPKRNPVAGMGIAFVAWTRVTTWQRLAFRNLPQFADFLAVRQTKDFQLRESFESWADAAHDRFMESRGMSPCDEEEQHLKHFRHCVRRDTGLEPTPAEVDDLVGMLRQRGVLPIPPSLIESARQRLGGTDKVSMAQVVAAFRGSRQVLKGDGMQKSRRSSKLTGGAKGKSRQPAGDLGEIPPEPTSGTSDPAACPKNKALLYVFREVLREHGFSEGDIEDALKQCGADLQRAVELCIQRSHGMEIDAQTLPFSDDDASLALMRDMGFHVQDITASLELADFDFSVALRLLLAGLDEERSRRLTGPRKAALPSSACAQYRQRAAEEYPPHTFTTVDLGMVADGTSNACFWLALAAGWSRCTWEPAPQHEQPQWLETIARHATVGALLTEVFHRDQRPSGGDEVGRLAAQLRSIFCAGDSSVMRQREMVRRWFPAFAALNPNDAPRTMGDYHRWLQDVATRGFADELVVAAVAMFLRIKIVVVPFTPRRSAARWRISEYQPPGEPVPMSRTIFLGNDDLHYVWLSADVGR